MALRTINDVRATQDSAAATPTESDSRISFGSRQRAKRGALRTVTSRAAEAALPEAWSRYSVAQVVDHTIEQCRAAARHCGVRLEVEDFDASLEAIGSAAGIAYALGISLRNAIDRSSRGGLVSLRVMTDALHGNERMKLLVVDRGGGIAANRLREVFTREGGHNLQDARSIMRAHCGDAKALTGAGRTTLVLACPTAPTRAVAGVADVLGCRIRLRR